MKKMILLLTAFIFGYSVSAQNAFTFKLYESINKKDDQKNVLFSPTSIMTAFAMVYEGAESGTKKEFESVFNFKPDNKDFIEQLAELKKVAEISNSIWILNNYKILPSYLQKMKALYNASPYNCAFLSDPAGSAKKINDWISTNTKGLIQKMVTPADVQDFKMALVNAIYFKQKWKIIFDKERNQKAPFYNLDGTETEVELMHNSQRYLAAETAKEKIISIPYEDDKTSMLIIMPNEMKKYKLDNSTYNQLTANLYNQEVNLHLPKFTFETPTFELKELLVDCGLKTAFSDGADFSGMRKERDLKIGTALHKAKIIVNEEGTEAAAATVVGMVQTTSVSTPRAPMQMRVDKPFFYFIKDNTTGSILFMGRMNSL
ncbi:MAG: serpin family protein [Crocinitomicaceae bacterium]